MSSTQTASFTTLDSSLLLDVSGGVDWGQAFNSATIFKFAAK